ncbi:MAG: transporter permease [Bacteroidetes bacterium]|jgi:MFS family permease|nr:transporter permease [Bacteroidota bacterium]
MAEREIDQNSSSGIRVKIFTRTIWVLSFVSLFNDIGSEILIPVMPIYLKSIGFTALWIGILEGIAEAVAGISKGYFGKLSDEKGRRLPFVQWGYSLSAVSKPLMALFAYPVWVLFMRIGDRLGKGLRTGARDAMLSDECSKENKGKVFGLHRSMDTVGAVIGPILALLFLYYYPGQYKTLFLLTFIPGLAVVALTFIIKEKKREAVINLKKGNFFSFFKYWKVASPEYKKLVTGLLLFTFFNSSDVFLLLMAKTAGMDDTHVIAVYVFYNLVYAVFAYPLGVMADKIAMKPTFIFGLILFVIVYTGMAFLQNELMMYSLFFIYGIYAAATDGVSKAWLTNLVPKTETATAIGFYASWNSIMAMISSSLAGLIWVMISPSATFLFAAIGVSTVIAYLLFRRDKNIIAE